MARTDSPFRDSQQPPRYRIVVLGGSGVGKTAILKRFLDDTFVDKYRETVEDLHCKTFDVNNQLIQAHIFDTAGNMEFPAMRRLNIGNAQAFLLVYDLCSLISFYDMEALFDEIKDVRTEEELRHIPFVIAGNKCDMPIDLRRVTRQQIDEFMLNRAFYCQAEHLETSAKTGHNVRPVFETFVRLTPDLLGDPAAAGGKTLSDQCKSPHHRAEHAHQHGATQNGGSAHRTAASAGAPVYGGSPVRQKPHPKTQRRFSLQAIALAGLTGGGSSNANSRPTTPELPSPTSHGQYGGQTPPGQETPTGVDSRKGSVPLVVVNKRLNRPFLRRHKTKSHEELDIQECHVQ